MRKGILQGLICGLLAWLVYGTVETVLPMFTQFWRQPDVTIMSWQWRSIAILISVYALTGIAAGVLIQFLLALSKRDRTALDYQISAALSIIAGFTLHEIMAGKRTPYGFLALAVAITLGIALLRGMFVVSWQKHMAFLCGPLTVALLLLGLPWLDSQIPSRGRCAALWLVWCILTVSFAVVASRVRHGVPARPAGQLGAACVILAIFSIGFPMSRAAIPMLHFPSNAADRKPNVLLITMDTVRADHLPMFGYDQDTSPHLREFSQNATLYSAANATSDFTLPTHASIFTGLYPSWHGAQVGDGTGLKRYHPLPPGPKTLAEFLGSSGYATAAVIANYGFLDPRLGVMRGYATVDCPTPVYLGRLGLGATAIATEGWVEAFTPAMNSTRRGSTMNKSVFALLRQAKDGNRPFFLFANYMDAHAPYTPAPRFESKFRGWDPRLTRRVIDRQQVIDGKRHLEAAEQAYLISQYDAGIATEDAAIGDLLDYLRTLQLYDNTLIVITADHGEALGERGLLDHGLGTVYQNQVHIPLLIKYPEQKIAERSDLPVSQIDILPTVLDVAAIQPQPTLPGRSLRNPPMADPRPIFVEARYGYGSGQTTNPKLQGSRRAVVVGSMKYVTWTNGPPELYDLATDPGEEHDLHHLSEQESKALANVVQDWAKSIPRQAPQTLKIDKGVVEQLKSLGYMQ
jgi:arylsulfatase A-like enzyme